MAGIQDRLYGYGLKYVAIASAPSDAYPPSPLCHPAIIQTMNDGNIAKSRYPAQQPPASPLPHQQPPHRSRQTTANDGCGVVHGGGDTTSLVMFIVDRVVEEDRLMLANEFESITLPDEMTKHSVPPCIHLRYLRGPLLTESVRDSYNPTFRALTLVATPPLPLLLITLSDHPAFLFALRCARIVFLLLKQFSSEHEKEAEVILTLLINLLVARLTPANLGLRG
ncbi:hypothetical protein BGY98DRAFT_1102642 [Russula aff. rugulosa BPL654]|nr:hypothetical protein BGY98DRAFT_1102642 [Russula aff. rugulosa BPL654]